MNNRTGLRLRQFTLLAVASVVLAACASKMGPAQKMIARIDSVVAAASTQAAKYVPNQLKDVQDKVAALKTSFANKDYVAVITGAPAVLASAHGLAAAAAAKKAEVMQALNDKWTTLSGGLPGNVTDIQHRIELLARNPRMAHGIDLAAAKKSLSDINTTWSQAQGAFAAGNLQEAVTTAKDVESKVESLATAIKLKLPQSPAAAAAPASAN